MSFVINTPIDKNQELLDAYKDLYESNNNQKDVFLISKQTAIPVDSFALALSSDFFRTLLSGNQRDTVNIIIPDICPDILKKVVEYIYIGQISLNSKYMADFIEACNLLQLKATISCERKLVFDKVQKSSAATITTRETSTPLINKQQANLDSLIADLEQEETVEYHLKHENEESGQILEVYEISNIEEAGISYEEANETDEVGEEHYELMNVETDVKHILNEADSVKPSKSKRAKPMFSEIKPRVPAKMVDEDIMNKAVMEIISNENSFRIVSEKYQIPKTLLWRRAKKMGYVRGEKKKDSSRLDAIEEIKRGESLISLSKKYNIPISTLHREKLKLYEKGQLPENVNLKNRSRGEDYDDRLRYAISEILNGKSQNEVAKRYNIPKTTIWRIIKKVDPSYKDSGVTITPESEIVDQLLQLSKKRSTMTIKLEYAEEDDDKTTLK